MARFAFIVSIFLWICVFQVYALPTLRKESEAVNNEKSIEPDAALEAELGKLKQDGVAIQKTEHTSSENINGKTRVSKTEKETVSDAKTGKVVASISKTITKDKNGEQKEAHVDVPAAGIHQEMSGADAENIELLSADDVARYIFDTSDIDGVKSAVQTLVDKKKISKKAADNYVQEIKGRLDALHEQALKEMTAEIQERRQDEDSAYKEMLSMAQVLNTNAEQEQALYLYAKKLYMTYRMEGDEYAKELLNQFTNALQKEVDADIILRALKDANDEMSQADGKEPQTQITNKLPKD